jgi:hypothetical protein
MATVVAAGNGNYLTGGTWTGGSVPGSSDTAQTGAYTVTIDGNITATQIEATSSGHFEVTSGGKTINANVVMSSTYANSGGVRCTHNSGTVTINGNITASGAGTYYHAVCLEGTGTLTIVATTLQGASANIVRNISTGTINITATNINGPTTGNRNGIYNASTGAINITGDINGGNAANSSGLRNAGNATVTITGNVTGGAAAPNWGVYNEAGGTINISGTATGGGGEYSAGAYNASTGTVTCDQAIGGTHISAPGLKADNASGTTTYKRIGVQTNGTAAALIGYCKMVVDTDYNVITVRNSGGTTSSLSDDYPAVTDVRDGVVYNRTTLEGTLTELGLPDAQYILEAGGGNYHAPSVGEVIDTAVFGPSSGTPGTFKVPPIAKVEDNYQYGAGGTQYEGTLVASGGSVSIEALSAEVEVG